MTKSTNTNTPAPTRAVAIDSRIIERALKGDRSGRTRISDSMCAGLKLVVGARSAVWEYSYRPRGVADGGMRHPIRTVKIGDVISHAPNAARAAADEIKAAVAAGRDPAGEKVANAAAEKVAAARRMTLERLLEPYVESHLGSGTAHHRNEAGYLRAALAEMEWGALEPGALRVADLKGLVDKHRAKPATAVHRLGAVARFLDALVDDEIIEMNPARMLSRKSRPKPAKARATYPTAAELKALWDAAPKLGEVKSDYLRCLMLLPLRRSELAGATVAAYDAASDRIVLEGYETKNGDDFAIACPPAAREIIKRRVQAAGGDKAQLLFPMSSEPGEPMRAWSKLMKAWRRDSGLDAVKLHDMRRLFASELAEHEVGTPDLVDALLNHRQSETRSGVKGVYMRAQLVEPRRQIMEAWGRLVEHAVENGKWPREEKGGFAKLALVQ